MRAYAARKPSNVVRSPKKVIIYRWEIPAGWRETRRILYENQYPEISVTRDDCVVFVYITYGGRGGLIAMPSDFPQRFHASSTANNNKTLLLLLLLFINRVNSVLADTVSSNLVYWQTKTVFAVIFVTWKHFLTNSSIVSIGIYFICSVCHCWCWLRRLPASVFFHQNDPSNLQNIS